MSLAAKVLGFNVGTPVFDGANEYDIMDTLELANDYVNTPLNQKEKEQKIAEAQEAGDRKEVSRLTDIIPFEDKYKDLLDPENCSSMIDNQDYRKSGKAFDQPRWKSSFA